MSSLLLHLLPPLCLLLLLWCVHILVVPMLLPHPIVSRSQKHWEWLMVKGRNYEWNWTLGRCKHLDQKWSHRYESHSLLRFWQVCGQTHHYMSTKVTLSSSLATIIMTLAGAPSETFRKFEVFVKEKWETVGAKRGGRSKCWVWWRLYSFVFYFPLWVGQLVIFLDYTIRKLNMVVYVVF